MTSLSKLLLLGVLAGCSANETTSSASQPIIGGTPDGNDPSVVLMGGGGVWCTGTLVAPKVVLTAAHCIGPKNSFVYFGPQYLGDAGGSTLTIAQSYPHPDYATNKSVDIGIVILATPSPVAPSAINTTALSQSDAGKTLHVVGFGDTASPAEPMFTKMQVDVPISSVTSDAIMSGPAICSGDSGGPAMLTMNAKQVVAGVTSGHSIQACGGTAGYVRVDLYAQWIQQQIDLADVDAAAPPPDAGATDASPPIEASTNDAATANEPDAGTTETPSGGCSTSPSRTRGGSFAALAIACLAFFRRRGAR